MTAGLALLGLALALGSGPPPPNGRPADEQLGQVVLDATTAKLNLPVVTFEHATHRARHTCRVCHVDVGFALRAGESQITATSIEGGAHCGACHNGVEQPNGQVVFKACGGWPMPVAARGCTRCHSGLLDGPSAAYAALRDRLPVDAAGYLDWEAAERRQLVQPADSVPGVRVKRPSMRVDRDITLSGLGTWLRPVTFSHARHARWSGCGMCHPEVFPLGSGGAPRSSMDDMWAGRSCGVCHRRVAFPMSECQRCHADQQRRFERPMERRGPPAGEGLPGRSP